MISHTLRQWADAAHRYRNMEQMSVEKAVDVLALAPRGTAVLVLGSTDTGKTTFVRRVVSRCVAERLSVGIIDCDVGQSEIGPPGTVGAAIADAKSWNDSKGLHGLKPLSLYFVGAVSPVRHLLPVCAGAVHMESRLRSENPDLILVDTGGLIPGNYGVLMARYLTDLLRPGIAILMRRTKEAAGILPLFAHRSNMKSIAVVVPETVARKSPAARAIRRTARLFAAFEDWELVTFSLDDVSLVGTALDLGAPLPRHVREFLSASLDTPVLHAEQSSDGIAIFVNGSEWNTGGFSEISTVFQTKSILVVPAKKFAGLLVGLIDGSGNTLDIGAISRIDFDARTITVGTACRRKGAVAQLWMGALRVRRDGKELGETLPWEI